MEEPSEEGLWSITTLGRCGRGGAVFGGIVPGLWFAFCFEGAGVMGSDGEEK